MKSLLVQKIRRLNQTGNINTYSYKSQFQLLPLHNVISAIVTIVSFLSNLLMSGCGLKDNKYISFILLLRQFFTAISAFSDF